MKSILTLVAASVLALATNAFAQNDPFSGVYVSAAGGYADLSHAFQSTGSIQAGANPIITRNVDLSQGDYMGSFSLGYGHVFAQKWYVGTEFGYDLFNGKHEERTGDRLGGATNLTDINIRLSHQYRWGVLLGRDFNNDVLVAVKLSALRAADKYDIETSGGIYPSGPVKLEEDGMIWGGQAGVDVLINLVSRLNLKLEYDYSFYSSLAKTQDYAPPPGALEVKDKASGSTFMAGLSYTF
jgi:opacity protein-like surface antigen